MNRPEMTNLNHQYAIRRVDMDFSWVPEPEFGLHQQYCRPQRTDVNCFTFGAANATVNGVKQQFEPPADYRLESEDGVLTLHFTLPFRSPLMGQTLELEVYDPSYFVDIRLAEQAPVELINTPSQCKFAITRQTWTQVANRIAVTCS